MEWGGVEQIVIQSSYRVIAFGDLETGNVSEESRPWHVSLLIYFCPSCGSCSSQRQIARAGSYVAPATRRAGRLSLSVVLLLPQINRNLVSELHSSFVFVGCTPRPTKRWVYL